VEKETTDLEGRAEKEVARWRVEDKRNEARSMCRSVVVMALLRSESEECERVK
jgi:hypothetical protein